MFWKWWITLKKKTIIEYWKENGRWKPWGSKNSGRTITKRKEIKSMRWGGQWERWCGETGGTYEAGECSWADGGVEMSDVELENGWAKYEPKREAAGEVEEKKSIYLLIRKNKEYNWIVHFKVKRYKLIENTSLRHSDTLIFHLFSLPHMTRIVHVQCFLINILKMSSSLI